MANQDFVHAATARVRVEHEIVWALIHSTAWLERAAGCLDDFVALTAADRELVTVAGDAIRPQVESQHSRSVHLEVLRLLCFVEAKWKADQGWREGLKVSIRDPRALSVGISNSGGIDVLSAYQDAPAAQVALIREHASRFGIHVPVATDVLSTVRLLDGIRRLGPTLADAPAWRTYSELTAGDVEAIVALLLTVRLHRLAEYMPMYVTAKVAATGPVRLTPHFDRLAEVYDHLAGMTALAASPKMIDRLLAGSPRRAAKFLPWIRDDQVLAWARSTRAFTLEAGWEVAPDGSRRDLHYGRSFALEQIADQANAPVRACVPGDYAGGGLLLDVDLTDSRTAMLGLARDRLQIPFALSLSPGTHDTMYYDIYESGIANPREVPAPEFLLSRRRSQAPIQLGRERTTPFEAVYPARIPPLSQFGGCPSWLQDPWFPPCSSCRRSMTCIAQICLDEVGWTGLVHVFLCTTCEIAAAAYECD